jgi:hypothetical protein
MVSGEQLTKFEIKFMTLRRPKLLPIAPPRRTDCQLPIASMPVCAAILFLCGR